MIYCGLGERLVMQTQVINFLFFFLALNRALSSAVGRRHFNFYGFALHWSDKNQVWEVLGVKWLLFVDLVETHSEFFHLHVNVLLLLDLVRNFGLLLKHLDLQILADHLDFFDGGLQLLNV